jgi:hypothetical protein
MTNKDQNNIADMYKLIRENDEAQVRIPFETSEGSFTTRRVAIPDTEEERESIRNIINALDLPVDWEEGELLDVLRSNGFGWGRRYQRKEHNK